MSLLILNKDINAVTTKKYSYLAGAECLINELLNIKHDGDFTYLKGG